MPQMRKGKSACYCINFRRAANSISQFYDAHLAPIELSVNQFSLLRNIGRLGVCSVSDLANYVGLERTTLVRTLKPLIERRLVEDASAEGQRNRALQLTALGEAAVAKGIPLWENAQGEIERKLGREAITELEKILTKLTD